MRANEIPPLYRLKDLKGDLLKGFYYKESLTKSPKPSLSDFFEVESVLKKKKIKNVVYYLVKYLYYPSKFNEWIPETNFNK